MSDRIDGKDEATENLPVITGKVGEEALPGVYIKTFGCLMNEYDSEKILRLLSAKYRPVESVDEAEVVIVNTCSVREKGEHKLFSLLGTLRDMKRERDRRLIVGVAGCVAQQEGDSIARSNKAVDFVVGTHNLSLVPSLVEQSVSASIKRDEQQKEILLLKGSNIEPPEILAPKPLVAVDYREEWEELPLDYAPIDATANPYKVRALVSIQRGCNKRCAFCVVPTTRGPEVSRAQDEILREVALKVRLGAREVMLLGQTVNSYGRDLVPRSSFANLVRRLADIEGLKRIRFISPHPAEVFSEFIDLYAELPQLCPHIHLPLQSGSDRILKLMNRNYRMRRYYEIVDSIRAKRPDIAISTDIIVGFPTETDEDFRLSLEALNRVRFDFSYSFTYSERPNTTALNAFSQEQLVPAGVAKERLAELQALQDKLCLESNRAIVGSTAEVLVESFDEKIPTTARGRSPRNTLVEVLDCKHGVKVGDLLSAQIESCTGYGLRGRYVPKDGAKTESFARENLSANYPSVDGLSV